jgi:hypothetical protein
MLRGETTMMHVVERHLTSDFFGASLSATKQVLSAEGEAMARPPLGLALLSWLIGEETQATPA